VGEEGDWLTAAFDAAVLMKVPPKFHGSRSRLEEPLATVLAICVSRDHDAGEMLSIIGKDGPITEIVGGLGQQHYRFPQTARRAIRMIRFLLTDGFAAFG
jgi:5-methylcytosine-specific restriction endonuclease McrBC GTP-binding regulatory subunit McrB